MEKVETVFTVKNSGSYYADLPPAAIPSKEDEILLQGKGSPGGWFEVMSVDRSYNLDDGELTLVNVGLRPVGWRD